MSNILYHSAYGGTLVFEPNDSLEHKVDYGPNKSVFDRDREVEKYRASIKSRDINNDAVRRLLKNSLKASIDKAQKAGDEYIDKMTTQQLMDLTTDEYTAAVSFKIGPKYTSPWMETTSNYKTR